MKICPQCSQTFDDRYNVCPNDHAELISNAGDPMIGRLLDNRYRMTKKIGEGGMGAIYTAVHSEMGRTCAIKLLTAITSGHDEALARFKREAKMASRIDNPHAVTIYDFGEAENGLLFLAMEFIDGRPLSGIISENRTLPIDRVVHITGQIAEALTAAHALGIVHRDLKPDNVMITHKGGDNDYVKVLDFGIAKTVADDSPDHLTKTGYVLGTPVYMSPEQLLGERLDGRSDIYSLAIIVYEMLSGKLPFIADNQQAVMMKRITGLPVPLRTAAPHVTEDVERVVMQGLAREPEDRIAHVMAFAEALNAAAHGDTGRLGKGSTRRISDQAGGQTVSWLAGSVTEANPVSAPNHDATIVLQSHSTMQSGPETQEITEPTGKPTQPQTAGSPQSLPPTQVVTPASPLAATEKVSPPAPQWHAPTMTAPIPQRPDPLPGPPAVTGEMPRRKPVALIAIIAVVVIGLGIAALLFFIRGGSGMTLTLKNAPPGAQVFINDANRGSIGPDGTLKIAGVNPGQATVRLVHDKFSDFTTTVSGNKGDEKAIEALMLPTEIDYNGPMVLIPAGQFLMGNNSGPDDEKPAHNVTLPAYYIDKYEVTNEQYKRFCDAERGGKYPETTIGPNYVTQNPKLPVVAISYDDAVEFAKWDGKRLPNEAEWEKAASWDPKTQQKHKYPWGEAENAGSANIGRNEVAHLASGGTNASDVSTYGVFDMGGNVGEWVDGMYTPYDGNRVANDNYGKQRLVRGASMHSKIDEARTTFRGSLPVEIPADKLKGLLIGIRCAISADDPRLLEYLRSRIKP